MTAFTRTPGGLLFNQDGSVYGAVNPAGVEVPILQAVSGLQAGSSASVRTANALALAAAFSKAGGYQLPVGAFESDPFTITASVTVVGSGASNAYGPINEPRGTAPGNGSVANTKLLCVSPTADFITIAAPGVIFDNFHIEQTGTTPTAGSGIKVGVDAVTAADNFRLQNCSIKRFWTEVDVINGVGYSIHDNVFFAPVKYGIRVQNLANGDEGDPCIYANWFCSVTAADAALYFKSGGGIKFWGNKVWRAPPSMINAPTDWFVRGIHVDNPGVLTSVMTVTTNSFETIGRHAIFVDCSTSGDYSNITIGENQIFSQGSIGGENVIEIAGRPGLLIHCVSISGNVCHQTVGIKLSYVEGGAIGQNVWHQPRSALVTLGPGTAGVDVLPQAVGQPGGAATPNGSVIYFQDLDVSTWKALLPRGTRVHKYTREMGDGANSQGPVVSTYSTLFQLRIPEYGSVRFTCDFNVSSAGNGQASMSMQRLIAVESAVGTVAIVGTDTGIARISGTTAVRTIAVSATNPVCGDLDVRLLTGTVAGGNLYVNIDARLAAGAAGANLTGTVTLTVDGAVERVQRGP